MFINLLLLLLLCVGLQLHCCHGTKITFYENENDKGYLFESSLVSSCTNLPSYTEDIIRSIKTDTCMMIYLGKNCTSYSLKVEPGSFDLKDITSGALSKYYSPLRIRSYHVCNATEGGSQLDVDFYDDRNWEGSIIGSYRDVCSCQNLPKNIHELSLSLNNHGNSVILHLRENCEDKNTEKKINAGKNPESGFIPYFLSEFYEESVLVKAFRPHLVPRHCVKLYSNIIKFEFLNSIKNGEDIIEKNVELAAKTVFRNNGSATLTQEYSVTKSIRESVEFEIASSFESMHKVSVELSVETETEGGLPFFAKTKFTAGLKTAYENTKTSMNSENKKTSVETEREFSIKQLIEVKPCTKYAVQGFVRMVKNKRIEYKIYTKITGELGKEKMTVEQIRSYMDKGLEYVRDFDDHTVVAMATGLMKAEYGVDSVLSGDGERIADCMNEKEIVRPLDLHPEDILFQCEKDGSRIKLPILPEVLDITSGRLPVKEEETLDDNIEISELKKNKIQLICKHFAGMNNDEYHCKAKEIDLDSSSNVNEIDDILDV